MWIVVISKIKKVNASKPSEHPRDKWGGSHVTFRPIVMRKQPAQKNYNTYIICVHFCAREAHPSENMGSGVLTAFLYGPQKKRSLQSSTIVLSLFRTFYISSISIFELKPE